jgi:hypothetical protein
LRYESALFYADYGYANETEYFELAKQNPAWETEKIILYLEHREGFPVHHSEFEKGFYYSA